MVDVLGSMILIIVHRRRSLCSIKKGWHEGVAMKGIGFQKGI